MFAYLTKAELRWTRRACRHAAVLPAVAQDEEARQKAKQPSAKVARKQAQRGTAATAASGGAPPAEAEGPAPCAGTVASADAEAAAAAKADTDGDDWDCCPITLVSHSRPTCTQVVRPRYPCGDARLMADSPQPKASAIRCTTTSYLIRCMRCCAVQEVMADPVVCADGHTYERVAIEGWLAVHDTSPKTGAPLDDKTLTTNHVLRSVIQQKQQRRRQSPQAV